MKQIHHYILDASSFFFFFNQLLECSHCDVRKSVIDGVEMRLTKACFDDLWSHVGYVFF